MRLSARDAEYESIMFLFPPRSEGFHCFVDNVCIMVYSHFQNFLSFCAVIPRLNLLILYVRLRKILREGEKKMEYLDLYSNEYVYVK